MEKITIGNFYGFSVFMEIPKEFKDKDFPKMFENWLDSQKKQAVEEFKLQNNQKFYERHR